MENPIPVICDRCRAEGVAGEDPFSGIADILGFEPVPRRPHADGWTPEYQRAFIAALAVTGSARRAGRAIGKHAFGAEQLRTARGGRSFAAAWDAALEIHRDREMARLRDNLAGLASDQELRELPHPSGRAGGDGEEEDAEYLEWIECQGRIRDRLLRARRLFLAAICEDLERRAAWEILVGPVDWEKARRTEPQDDEPFGLPSARAPDMLLTAEAGLLPEATGGPSLVQQLLDALEEMRGTASKADDA
ncbi:hypothetical protein ACFQRC_05410 [Enterovirga sp. GCM10030262]|uniref:hypothetical protein n=1 Tax=Enterovirga sp. GCM10030262 TaxID=3273391 RepID=UPI003621B264